MTRGQRSAQIWAVLSLCARQRQTLTYELLAGLIGVPRHGLGQLLEPIQSYCILNELPPLSGIVVSAETGAPGEGFIAAADVPRAQQVVFRFDWSKVAAPTVDALEKAGTDLPSNGKTLAELEASAAKVRGGR